MTMRGIARGRMIEFEEPLPFEEGQELDVSIEPRPSGSPRGSGAAIMAALKATPLSDPTIVDEFEAAIKQGKRPIQFKGVFDDE